MMRKILVGTDLSHHSEVAVAHAIDRARREDAEVVLVMVHPFPEDPTGWTPRGRMESRARIEREERRLAARRRELAELRQRWLGQGADISELVVDGHADERLAAVAVEIGADLIAVGSHGRTGVRRMWLGSVAERTARAAACNVLIARGDAPSGGYRHIVVGTDFSALSKLALRQAQAAAAPGARIDLVHCWAMSLGLDAIDAAAIGSAAELDGDLEAELRAEGAAIVAAARAGTDLQVTFHLLQRPAIFGLHDYAREVGADLIAVGSHGRRGVRRFILGSVAEATARHAACTTLIAR